MWEVLLSELPEAAVKEFRTKMQQMVLASESEKLKLIKEFVVNQSKKKKITVLDSFFKDYKRLFSYGAIKENIPNKLIQKMKLMINVQINKNIIANNKKYILRSDNFNSHILMKITEID